MDFVTSTVGCSLPVLQANTLLSKIYETGLVEDADGNAVDAFGPSVPPETGALLYDLVRQGAARTLEIGMAYGVSSLHICQAHRDNGSGSHTAIDPFQDKWKSIGVLNIRRAELEDVLRFIQAPSCVALPQLLKDDERFDLAFIDGAHRFDNVLLDFFYVDCLLNVGGVVVFHDVGMPSVYAAASYILRNRAYEVVRAPSWETATLRRRLGRAARNVYRGGLGLRRRGIPLRTGNTLALRKTDWDARPWDFHRAF